MAQSGYTPILIYASGTTGNTPAAGNLTSGANGAELAINYFDGKLFYKDSGGVVQVLASKGAGTVPGSSTQVIYNSSGAFAASSNLTFDGTTLTANTLNLTNKLAIAYGGTNSTTTPTAGAVAYGTGTAYSFSAAGSSSQVLLSGGTGSPTWSNQSALSVGTSTNIAGGSAGAIAYNSGAGATTFLSLGTTNYVLTAGASAPQYVAQSTLSVGSATTATNVAGGAAGSLVYQTGSGATTTLALGTTGYFLTAGATAPQWTQTLPVANGGTGQTSYLDGQLLIGNTATGSLSKSTLTAGSGVSITNGNGTITIAATGSGGTLTSVGMSVPAFLSVSPSTITTSGTFAVTLSGTALPVANGGTGQTAYTDGQLLIGNTATGSLSKATLTAGSGVSITNGNGTISIAATGSGGTVTSVSWTGGIVSVANGTTTPAFTIAGTSGGIPYFDSATTWATSAALANNAIMLGGGAGAAPKTTTTGTGVVTAIGNNTNSANGLAVLNASAALAVANGGTGQTSYTDGQLLIGNSVGNTLTKATLTAGSGISITNGNGSISIAATGGGGTVTSVSWTGGIVSVANGTTTPAFTIAGTSGGIPYFSSASTWATSAALAANAIVLGGGAGAAPATTTTGTGVVTAIGNAVNTAGGLTTIDGTATLTNKRVTPRVSTTTSSATPTINTDNVDIYGLTAQAVDITSFTTNLSGTPTNGQKLWIYIVGTAARAITWGASFEASTVLLPTTTVSTNRLDVGFVWNAATSKWRCVATA